MIVRQAVLFRVMISVALPRSGFLNSPQTAEEAIPLYRSSCFLELATGHNWFTRPARSLASTFHGLSRAHGTTDKHVFARRDREK